MKTPFLILLSVGVMLAMSTSVRSQLPGSPQTHLQQLQTIKVQNDKLIERQAATLQKLEELQLQAQQIKFLGKRS